MTTLHHPRSKGGTPRNTILNGDCITLMHQLDRNSIDFILTDPPYITRYRGRDGRAVANDDNARWLRPAFSEMHHVLKPGGFCVSFYGWNKVDLFMDAWRTAGFRIVGHIVFRKRYASSSRFGIGLRHFQAGMGIGRGAFRCIETNFGGEVGVIRHLSKLPERRPIRIEPGDFLDLLATFEAEATLRPSSPRTCAAALFCALRHNSILIQGWLPPPLEGWFRDDGRGISRHDRCGNDSGGMMKGRLFLLLMTLPVPALCQVVNDAVPQQAQVQPGIVDDVNIPDDGGPETADEYFQRQQRQANDAARQAAVIAALPYEQSPDRHPTSPRTGASLGLPAMAVDADGKTFAQRFIERREKTMGGSLNDNSMAPWIAAAEPSDDSLVKPFVALLVAVMIAGLTLFFAYRRRRKIGVMLEGWIVAIGARIIVGLRSTGRAGTRLHTAMKTKADVDMDRK